MTTQTDFPRSIDPGRDAPLEPCPSWCDPEAHSAQFASDFSNRTAVEYFENRDCFRTHHLDMYDGYEAAVVIQQPPRREVFVDLAVFSGKVPGIVHVELPPAEALALGHALIESAGKVAQR